jgi:hypothetical protein
VGWITLRNVSGPHQVRETTVPTIDKQPAMIARHTFDPTAPPADMPPLSNGEIAVCDTNFVSNANVRGETRRADDTHGTLTITQVNVALQLHVNIWVPTEASQQVIEHEDGHRQISEHYYETADKIAQRIAAMYMGRQVEIAGADLRAEASKVLEQTAAEVTAEYNKQLNPGPTQLLYDSITDHGRNDTVVKDAVAHAITNVTVEANQTSAE